MNDGFVGLRVGIGSEFKGPRGHIVVSHRGRVLIRTCHIDCSERRGNRGEGIAKTKDERLRYRVYGGYPVSVSRAGYLNGTSLRPSVDGDRKKQKKKKTRPSGPTVKVRT